MKLFIQTRAALWKKSFQATGMATGGDHNNRVPRIRYMGFAPDRHNALSLAVFEWY